MPDGARDLGDEEWLSQVGYRRADGTWKFPDRLRPLRDPPETDISMCLGRLTPAEARVTAFGAYVRLKPGRDAVRYFRVGTLRQAGFRVEHTPRHPGSPSHVSVFWDGDNEWDDTVAELLHSCGMEGEV